MKRSLADDRAAVHFRSCLATKSRADGNQSPVVAMGDCVILLELLRLKLGEFDAILDPSNPGRFRGRSGLKSDIERVMGAGCRVHITKWGASHMRGAPRNDERRGNKRHLIKMVEILNGYSDGPEQLRAVYHDCIRRHQRFWDGFSLKIQVRKEDSLQKRLADLLSLSSHGRVQQGLVFSALRRRYPDSHEIVTKRTFAGDAQSSGSGIFRGGDVQVWSGERPLLVIEVKDAVIDAVAWERVERTHGSHEYPLFLLGSSYRPASLQARIGAQSNVHALHLLDFFLSLVFLITMEEGLAPEVVLAEIVAIFNTDFCIAIENDPSIGITMIDS